MAELPVVRRLRKEMDTLTRELTVDLPNEFERVRTDGRPWRIPNGPWPRSARNFLEHGCRT
jgi:hypothetical protein